MDGQTIYFFCSLIDRPTGKVNQLLNAQWHKESMRKEIFPSNVKYRSMYNLQTK